MSARAKPDRKIGIGVIGLGLMGRVHVEAYLASNRARLKDGEACRIVAVSDRSVERLDGRLAAQGNLQEKAATKRLFDPRRVVTSVDPACVIDHPEVEVVSICTPTDTHVELAERVLRAGKHVLVEKPVSLDPRAIERLAALAHKSRKICMPAMCMRFWPGWSWLRAAIEDGRYGAVTSATFQRLASPPSWSRDFYGNTEKSGGALFDLHVHDADLVAWLFGAPKSVTSTGTVHHVTTQYRFARGPAHVVAEGGWDHAPGFPFRMRFVVVFERATAEFDLRRDPPLEIACAGRLETPKLTTGTGYDGEIRALLRAVRLGAPAGAPTLTEAALVTRVLAAERDSLAAGGRAVAPRPCRSRSRG